MALLGNTTANKDCEAPTASAAIEVGDIDTEEIELDETTETKQAADFVLSSVEVAVTVVVPMAMPVINPVPETVAMAEFEEVQATVWATELGKIVAEINWVSPTWRVMLDGIVIDVMVI